VEATSRRRDETAVPAVSLLRDAARRAVAHSSLTSVANEIGMTHRGLGLFLAGSRPRPLTIRKLHGWYIRGAAATGTYTKETAFAALAVLVAGLAPHERDATTANVLAALHAGYAAAGREPPEWIGAA
jgi:hypothetical protein